MSLIELLVAATILSGLSLVGVQLLWDTLSTRSKQVSIEASSDNLRFLINTLTKSIQNADRVEVVDSATLKIKGDPCRTIKFDSENSLAKQAINEIVPPEEECQPPEETATFQSITKKTIKINHLGFFSESDPPRVINIKIEGYYQDNLGDHPIYYETAVAPRVTL